MSKLTNSTGAGCFLQQTNKADRTCENGLRVDPRLSNHGPETVFRTMEVEMETVKQDKTSIWNALEDTLLDTREHIIHSEDTLLLISFLIQRR